MNIILLVLGFILLLKGADWFVDGASSIASRFGIPQLIIGTYYRCRWELVYQKLLFLLLLL